MWPIQLFVQTVFGILMALGHFFTKKKKQFNHLRGSEINWDFLNPKAFIHH